MVTEVESEAAESMEHSPVGMGAIIDGGAGADEDAIGIDAGSCSIVAASRMTWMVEEDSPALLLPLGLAEM
jgi:hypothetical protein